jgi:hypothetical protein
VTGATGVEHCGPSHPGRGISGLCGCRGRDGAVVEKLDGVWGVDESASDTDCTWT